MKNYTRLETVCREREGIVRVQITEKQKRLLESLLADAFDGFGGDPQLQLLTIAAIAREIVSGVLNEEQHSCIQRFIDPAKRTALVITNLPTGRIGATPKDGLRPSRSSLSTTCR